MINPATTQNANETLQLGKALGTKLIPGDLVLLFGDLGAGKTTMTREILYRLGLQPSVSVSSPTFTVLFEYEINNKWYAHIDLYRVSSARQFDPSEAA